MIILNNSYAFETVGIAEVMELEKPKSFNDSINGYLIKTRTRYSRWRFKYTLSLNRAQLLNLQSLFAESIGNLDFVDHRGFSWLTSTGSDDATHAYNTGADIEEERLTFTPDNGNGYETCIASWTTGLTFLVSARGLAGNTANIIESSLAMEHDVPSGTIDGINPTFTLSQSYSVFLLYVNGLEQKLALDYTLSGSTITFLTGAIPESGDVLDGYGVP